MTQYKYKRLYIVTSGDFGYAGRIAILLRSMGADVCVISLRPRPSSLSKKFALTVAFGFSSFIYLFRNYHSILRLRSFTYRMESEQELLDFYRSDESSSLFLMINYDSLIRSDFFYNQKNFLNFHPSLLPSYKGLGPIFWCFLDNLIAQDVKFGWSIHSINGKIDGGSILLRQEVAVPSRTSLFFAYDFIYFVNKILSDLSLLMNNGIPAVSKVIVPDFVRGAPTLKDVLFLYVKGKSTFHEYLRFFLNGGIVGLISWFLQLLVYKILSFSNLSSSLSFSISLYLSFCICVLINFIFQSKFVFIKKGGFVNFLVFSLSAITIVNIVSLLFINYLLPLNFQFFAYPFAAISVSPLVFFVKKYFVFRSL